MWLAFLKGLRINPRSLLRKSAVFINQLCGAYRTVVSHLPEKTRSLMLSSTLSGFFLHLVDRNTISSIVTRQKDSYESLEFYYTVLISLGTVQYSVYSVLGCKMFRLNNVFALCTAVYTMCRKSRSLSICRSLFGTFPLAILPNIYSLSGALNLPEFLSIQCLPW